LTATVTPRQVIFFMVVLRRRFSPEKKILAPFFAGVD
jgi:hypothetical protein